MARNRFDQFTKQFLTDALRPWGRVHGQREIVAGTLAADAEFLRSLSPSALGQRYGLLGRMARTSSLFEAFHQAPSPQEFLLCLAKWILWSRQRTRKKTRDLYGHLWLICGGRPSRVIRAFGWKPAVRWPAGVYQLSDNDAWHSKLVVVSELPCTRATLAVRLMGAGKTLRRAIDELARLDESAWERVMALPLVHELYWDIYDSPKQQRTREEEALMRATQQSFQHFQQRIRQEGIQEGIQEGVLQGKREGVLQGIQKGVLQGKREGVLMSIQTLCGALGIPFTPARKKRLQPLGEEELVVLLTALGTNQRWPSAQRRR